MSSFLPIADLLGGVLFGLTSLFVGGRLLWLARRTGELPELLIGLAFAVAGFAGYLLGLVPDLMVVSETARAVLPYVSRALIATGSVLIAIATWRIFHAGSATTRTLVVIFAALLLFEVFPLALGTPERDFWFQRATRTLVLLPYLWMSVASLRLRQRLHKRWRVGLEEADPELARRLGLWGLGTGAVGGLFVTDQAIACLNFYTTTRVPEELFIAVWGIACAVCMWLAFFGKASAPAAPPEPA
jgi:hypothetical protein